MPVSEGYRMRDKQKTKDQLINELAKMRQQIAKSEKSETEHKKTEKALLESEEKFRSIAEYSPTMIFINKKGRVVYANKTCEEIMGYKQEEFYSPDFDFFCLIAPESREVVKAAFGRHIEEREILPYEYTLITKEGNRVEAIITTKLIKYEADSAILGIVTDITERKKVEEALKELEVRYRELVEKSNIAILMDDKEGNFKYFNKKYADLFGYSVKEMKKQSIRSTVHPEDVDRVMKFHKELLRGKKVPSRYEFKGVKKDGSIIYLEVDAVKLKEGESIVGTYSYIWDITERKQTEEELREKEEFNFALFQYNPIETIVVDFEGRVVKINMAKRKAGDRLPNIGDLMYKDYAGKHEIDMHAELIECIKSGKAKRFPELKYGDKFLNITIAPFPKGAIITSQDITETKWVEKALRDSEGKYRFLFDNMLEGFSYCKIIVDKNNKPVDFEYIEVNDVFEKLTGLKKEYVTGKRVTEVIPGIKKAHPELFKIYGKVALTGKQANFDIYFEPLKIWLSISVYCPKRGYFVTIFDNITKRKKIEEEIKSSQSQLRNLTAHLQSVREEERTLIAREMHDELGQAMTALKMDISWLDNRLPKDQRSLLEKTKSMSKLADATLQTIKRISTELRPGLLDDLGLPAAIEWQGEEFQNRTGIKCEVTIDTKDIILDRDRSTAIFRIFQETLTNVARHTKAKRVKVSLKEKAGKVELKVRDNGKGITEEQISDSKSFGLIGIKERAHFLGGKVVIRGVQDKGTTVTARIPLPRKGKTR